MMAMVDCDFRELARLYDVVAEQARRRGEVPMLAIPGTERLQGNRLVVLHEADLEEMRRQSSTASNSTR